MSDNVQIKVFFGIILLAFFGGLYYRDNLSPDAKDETIQETINEAWDYCAKDGKGYGDTFENRMCVRDYLVDFKGISMKELNKFRIRQDLKNK